MHLKRPHGLLFHRKLAEPALSELINVDVIDFFSVHRGDGKGVLPPPEMSERSLLFLCES